MQKYIGCHLFVKSGNILTKRIYSVAFRGVRGREPPSRGVGDVAFRGVEDVAPYRGNPFGREPPKLASSLRGTPSDVAPYIG